MAFNTVSVARQGPVEAITIYATILGLLSAASNVKVKSQICHVTETSLKLLFNAAFPTPISMV